MAEIQPLRALRYDLDQTGGLQPVVAPPYDVIDAEQRARLEASSPYNVVRIDLPVGGEDRYERAAAQLQSWRDTGVIVADDQPALWTLAQDYTGPDGQARTRKGFFARVRVEDYGAGRIRPHERTHPGPKEDRLRLTRATRANLSPIFSLYSDPAGVADRALSSPQPWAQTTDADGTINHVGRVVDETAIAAVADALAGTELLIADGHHRYETARVYADEIGGDGPHRYVLMCLVALQDPGLTVFPTHRLVRGLRSDQHEALANTLRRDFEIEALADPAQLAPGAGDRVRIGYIDAHFKRPYMLTLKDQATADAALSDHAEPYRRLDTAVLEALILKATLGMTDHDIDELNGLGYARDFAQALELIGDASYDAAFFMAPTPIERVHEVAAAGESMPPKSTYFVPKVGTGLLFNPLA
ncbi:MAG: hypothetical protein QOF83_3901 [Solirubrobacteraceae bacterium]|jgi:uncharacterized protein (DUF1015 family)|nr:hypothetical protein [Solirubrobacteraceae bacterium]